MSDRPTPETDAMIETDAHRIEKYSAPLTAYRRMCELARTLERERDEWRKKAVDLHARHKNALEDIEAEMQACEEARDAAEKAKAYKRVLKDDNAKLRRERDKARDDTRVLLKEIFNITQIGDPHPADLPMKALKAIAEMIDEHLKEARK